MTQQALIIILKWINVKQMCWLSLLDDQRTEKTSASGALNVNIFLYFWSSSAAPSHPAGPFSLLIGSVSWQAANHILAVTASSPKRWFSNHCFIIIIIILSCVSLSSLSHLFKPSNIWSFICCIYPQETCCLFICSTNVTGDFLVYKRMFSGLWTFLLE